MHLFHPSQGHECWRNDAFDLLESRQSTGKVLIVPEGFIGIAFGFWWMNMMTMKTCYICNLGLVPKDTGPSCSAKG